MSTFQMYRVNIKAGFNVIRIFRDSFQTRFFVSMRFAISFAEFLRGNYRQPNLTIEMEREDRIEIFSWKKKEILNFYSISH